MVAIWIFGVIAGMAVGGEVGLWLFGPDVGLIWGALIGGYLFAFFRLWFLSPNEPPER